MSEPSYDYLGQQINEQVDELRRSFPWVTDLMGLLAPPPGETMIESFIKSVITKYGEDSVDKFLNTLEVLADRKIVSIREGSENQVCVLLTSKGELIKSKLK